MSTPYVLVYTKENGKQKLSMETYQADDLFEEKYTLHREDGPAETWFKDGDKFPYLERWYKDGRLHRENGPAIVYHGDREIWMQDGNYHRFDGPAIVYSQHSISFREKSNEYWIRGKNICGYIFRNILDTYERSDLANYLLSEDWAIRVLAEFRFKQLELK